METLKKLGKLAERLQQMDDEYRKKHSEFEVPPWISKLTIEQIPTVYRNLAEIDLL